MIIGNGLIANGVVEIHNEFPDVLFFASGVSDSKETDDKQFVRERSLLEESIKKNSEKKIIYFSTYSIEDDSRQKERYILHKKEMEKIIQSTEIFLIIRLTNVLGRKGNKNNLIRFLMDKIIQEEEINVWNNVKRNIVGIDDLVYVVSVILKNDIKNKTVLISHPYSFTMKEIIISISNYLGKQPIIKEVDKGNYDEFPCAEIVLNAFEAKGMDKKEYYLDNLLRKYCI
jgi:nucleoside-diphosphate-sugar epimerase